MLDLAPETETAVRDYAAREGVSTDVFTRRLLRTYTQEQQQQASSRLREESGAQAAPDFAASSEAVEAVEDSGGAEVDAGTRLTQQVNTAWARQDAQLAAVFAYINAPKEEIIRLHAADIAHFDAELAAAANATPEEIAQADAEWEEHKQRMNAHRAMSGARLLFDDVPPDVSPAVNL